MRKQNWPNGLFMRLHASDFTLELEKPIYLPTKFATWLLICNIKDEK
ncbi:hypothetical protein BUC_5759 [Burkholderia pseudomallei 576]|nr:hypothetical protein BUC_5759 [Burkholderia pseudomallei 576]